MADRRLLYTVGVKADTTLFKLDVLSAILSLLQIGLKNLLTTELKAASLAALELQANLASAFNLNTGKLDLLTFSKNLKQSGQTLDSYYSLITKLGPDGEQAFLKVALAINKAELPLTRSNKLLSNLWITMKNTMRWLLTSGALNAFTGALLTAYGYSKDLDRSLNSIRIITGKNIDSMREFSKEANDAAKALSTTTTDYTDASLIYYQLGLDDLLVRERVDTTIKLANVSNLAAEDVSSLMTAIWNNFYDGGKSLEYYADVITALGATTASSSEQIAQGVQKFAPIAQTVGLSYEYAATALATLVANTLQSADIVGTSLRTLFSRLLGLKLGETLDDGTDLNKYSEALNAVGVNIKDATGGLKDMDTLLDETAKKWGTLSRDLLMALAQTVAGVRQYTSFVALMDNWGDFLKNLNTALGSEGTLQKLADIYAESWEAARDRVRASAEDIYDSLINPLLYINMDNTLSPVLDTIADMVDGLGGLPGVLTLIGNLMLFAFGDKIASTIRDTAENVSILLGYLNKNLLYMKDASSSYIEELRAQNDGNDIFLLKLDLMEQYKNASIEESEILNKMTESEREAAKPLRFNLELLLQGAEAALKRAEAILQTTKNLEELMQDLVFFGDTPKGITKKDLVTTFNLPENTTKTVFQIKAEGFETTKNNIKDIIDRQERLRNLLNKYTTDLKGNRLALIEYAESLGFSRAEAEKWTKNGLLMRSTFSELNKTTDPLNSAIDILTNKLGISKTEVEQFITSQRSLVRTTIESELSILLAASGFDVYILKLKEIEQQAPSVSEQIVGISLALMAAQSFNFAFNSITNIVTDDALTGLERFNKILGSSITLLPIFLNLFKNTTIIESLKSVKDAFITGRDAAVAAGLGMFSFVGGIRAVGTEIKFNLPVIGLIITALSILTNAISTAIKKAEEARQAIRDQAYETAKSSKEEADSNRQLISSMQDALAVYKENGNNKEDLDKATLALTEAYNLEGSALAKLTGKYKDYNTVLEKAREQLLELLRLQLTKTITARESAAEELLSTAKKGLGQGQIGNNYIALFGEGIGSDILRQTVSGYDSTGDGALLFTIGSDTESLLKFYDELSNARDRMLSDSRYTTQMLANSSTYNDVTSWLDQMSDIVERYREYVKEVETLKITTGESDLNVSNLQEYVDWVNNTTETLKNAGYEGKELQEILSTVVDTSLNPDISGFKDLYDAINDIKNLVTPDLAETIDDAFADEEKYDANVLVNLNWTLVTDETDIDDLYEQALRYTDVITASTNALTQLTGAESALDIIKKAKGDLSADVLKSLSSAVDWGNEELGIIEFSEFLKMTLLDLNTYLNLIVSNSLQTLQTSLQKLIEISKENIELYQEFLALVDEDTYNLADAVIKAWDEILNVYNAYLNDRENFKVEDFNLSQGLSAIFENLKDKTEEEVKTAIEEATKNAHIIIDKVTGVQEALDTEIKNYESKLKELVIQARVNFDNLLDNIENSTSGIVAIFDAISKGVEKTTNEAGQAVYGLSLEAAKAIEELYPGFMANAELLRDGTFAMSLEMYLAFFDAEKGILSIDSLTKAGLLQNMINMLELRKENALSSLTIAEKLASGELNIYDLGLEDKELLYTDFVNGQKTANGEMLDDEVKALTLSDENWDTLWSKVSEYSSKAADNMADNVAISTGLVLENLEKIRNAAYLAFLGVSQIGTDTFTALEFDTKAKVTGQQDWQLSIDTSNMENFFKSLENLTPVTSNILFNQRDIENMASSSRAIGERLKEYFLDYINLIDKQIAAAKTAQSLMLGAMDDAYDKLAKAEKSSSQTSKIKDKEEIERYHYINRLLEEKKKLLEEIDELANRTYGTGRLELYSKKQLELTNQLDLYYQKLDEAQRWRASDKQLLIDFFNTYMPGVQIQFDGNHISNYEEIARLLIGTYNMIKDSDDKEAVNLAKWRLDEGLKLIKLLEETADLEDEINQAMIHIRREFKDLELEKINHTLEVTLDAKALRDNLRNWKKALIESTSDALYQGFSLGTLAMEQYTDDANMLYAYINKYNYLVNEFDNAIEGVTDKDVLRKEMTDLLEKIIGTGEDLLEFIDTMENLLPNAVSAAAERFAQFTSQLDHNVSVLGAIKELLSLQGVTYKTAEGFAAFNDILLKQMLSQSISALLNKLQYENWRRELEEAQAALTGVEEGDVAYDMLKGNRDAILEQYNQSLEAMLQSAQDVMNTAKEIFTMAIEQASYEFEKSMSGGLSFDLMQDLFDHYIEEEERYFDKVNELYQVNAWNNKLQQDIDNTTNKVYADRLRALLQEIDLRREGGTLSLYDLDVLEAKYNLLQAEMALEDALNAKNNLRLVRDSQGNWNYQYTADQGEIDKAQDQVLKALNDWYNISKKQTKLLTSDILKTYLDFNKAVLDVYNDLVLSDEQKAEKLIEIENFYTEKIRYLEEEKNIAVKDMTEAGKLTIEDFSNTYADNLDRLDGETEKFKEYAKDYLDTCDLAFKDYSDTVLTESSAIGTALGNEGLNKILLDIAISNDKIKDSGKEAINTVFNEIDKIQTITDAFADMAEEIRNALEAFNEYAKHATDMGLIMGGVGPDVVPSSSNEDVDFSALMAYAWLWDGRNAHGFNTLADAREKKMSDEQLAAAGYMTTALLREYFSWNSAKSDDEIRALAELLVASYARAEGIEYDEALRRLAELYKKYDAINFAGFDTGGYTGEFSNGRLAILHEKELVLNKEDTANILTAVSAIRAFGPEFFHEIEAMLDGNALATVGALSSLLNNYKVIDPVNGTVEQDVHIEAVFPNATDRNEIEEAFRSLNAGAAQWARRRKGD